MPELKNGKDCCGCTACEAICSQRAITMRPDALGFKYPEVDMEKCIECGACERVCSFNDRYATPDNYASPIPYGVRLKDIKEMMKSRSGGGFVAISNLILAQGGVVYGAGYKDHFTVAHGRASTEARRDEFRGSKYVQSDLNGIFLQIKADLQDGLPVLFSGTGCQVAGLNSFIPKSLKGNLLTVDIVCHGVPAPKIWEDFLSYLEKKEHATVVKVDFRDKIRFGWSAHKESITLRNNVDESEKTVSGDIFTYLFYQHIMLRPSCGECHFCNLRRAGDITLADFWGWEKTGSHINNDDKGLSLILINTPKGNTVFDSVKECFDIIRPRLEDCIQGHLKHHTELNPSSAIFKKDYIDHGFEYILKKYGNVGVRHKIRAALRRVRRVKSAIKKHLT